MAHLAAPTIHPATPVDVDAGLLLRIRAWFAALAPGMADRERPPRAHRPCCVAARGGAPAHAASHVLAGKAPASLDGKAGEPHGAIIAFPRSGQIQLMQLAEDLERRFASLGLDNHEPVQLRLERGAEPCLWIDSTAYIEACGATGRFRVVLNDAFKTRITMETSDFASIAAFVRHYIVARFAAACGPEGMA
jgi:hypothetical protein